MKAYAFALACALLSPSVALAGGVSDLRFEKGFRALKWGASYEESVKAYPDLRRIEIDGKEQAGGNPSAAVVFRRDGEDDVLGGVQFESVNYVYKEGKLFGLVLHASSGIQYAKLYDHLRALYGIPAETVNTPPSSVRSRWSLPDGVSVVSEMAGNDGFAPPATPAGDKAHGSSWITVMVTVQPPAPAPGKKDTPATKTQTKKKK